MTATAPSALSPSAEPQIYVGIITSILVSAGLVTTGEATTLQPLLLAVIVALPTVLAIIQRQFATPNAKVAVAVQAAVTAATSTPPVAPAPVIPSPAPTTTSTGSTNVEVPSLVDAIAKLQGYIAELEAVQNPTPAQTAELATYRARLVEYQGRLAPAAPPAPTVPMNVVPFAGSFTATYAQALAIPNNAGPDANLTVNEYAVLVTGRNLTLDWLLESAHWMSDNVGSPSYLSQLFNRMNLLLNGIQRPDVNGMPSLVSGGELVGASVLPAVSSIQAEINRCELMGKSNGLPPAARYLDPRTFLPALVRGEGDYVQGSPQVQALLMAAPVGAAPSATNAWQAELAAAEAAGIMIMAQ